MDLFLKILTNLIPQPFKNNIMMKQKQKLSQYNDVLSIHVLMCSFSLEFSLGCLGKNRLSPLNCSLKEKKDIPAFAWFTFSTYWYFASVSAKCYRFNSPAGPRVKN